MLPNVLFLAFTLLASTGAFLIGAHFKGRRVAAALAVSVLVFMVLLYLYVRWLLQSAGY